MDISQNITWQGKARIEHIIRINRFPIFGSVFSRLVVCCCCSLCIFSSPFFFSIIVTLLFLLLLLLSIMAHMRLKTLFKVMDHTVLPHVLEKGGVTLRALLNCAQVCRDWQTTIYSKS